MPGVSQRAAVVRRARRPSRFVRVVVGISIGIQVPAAALLTATLWRAGVTLAPVIALLALCAANVPLGRLLAEGFTDRPTSRFRLHLVDFPYFTLWSTCFGFVFTAPVGWVTGIFAGTPALPTLQWTFLGTLGLGVYAVYVRRFVVHLRHVEVRVPGLPVPFEGYRIVQLSDLHVGAYVPPARARRWVARANALHPDLVALTGDLVSAGSSFLQATARTLGRLRARDGVVFSPGNHDYFCDSGRLFSLLTEEGIDVLRNSGRTLTRGGASLHVAGADDVWTRRVDVTAALAGRPTGVPVVLLAHDPRLWTLARNEGATLTLSGHTHGGQLALPFLGRWLNLARTSFEHTTGVYRRDGSSLVVSNGLGTTGPPARLGASPEIVEITLRRASL